MKYIYYSLEQDRANAAEHGIRTYFHQGRCRRPYTAIVSTPDAPDEDAKLQAAVKVLPKLGTKILDRDKALVYLAHRRMQWHIRLMQEQMDRERWRVFPRYTTSDLLV